MMLSTEAVFQMFPHTPHQNIERNLPDILQAANNACFDRVMLLVALATIRAETESFEPIAEQVSQYNTSHGGDPFDLYDHRHDLGNLGPPDGELFRGRGYVQLTGRANYQHHGLLYDPESACYSPVAARVLMEFLGQRQGKIRIATGSGNLGEVRKLVNGGSHGLDRFTDAWRIGQKVWPA